MRVQIRSIQDSHKFLLKKTNSKTVSQLKFLTIVLKKTDERRKLIVINTHSKEFVASSFKTNSIKLKLRLGKVGESA